MKCHRKVNVQYVIDTNVIYIMVSKHGLFVVWITHGYSTCILLFDFKKKSLLLLILFLLIAICRDLLYLYNPVIVILFSDTSRIPVCLFCYFALSICLILFL